MLNIIGGTGPSHRSWRGKLPRRIGLCTAIALGSVIAGCGGDDDGTGSKPDPGATAADVKQYLGPIDPKTSGKGMKIDVGVVVALSGAGSLYGKVELNGAKLAAKQIAELGGPQFNLVTKDNKSGDPGASARAARELGLANVSMTLSSYIAGLGAMLPDIAKSKMLTFDPGGGTSVLAQGQPYFWGTRAIVPNDAYPGITEYLRRTMPDVKRVAMVEWDLGGELNKGIERDTRDALKTIGAELVAFEPTQIGATDYATALQRIQGAEPDAIFVSVYGLDLANFMKQYASSGIGKPTFGFDLTKEASDAAGPAMEGMKFAYDYFDPSRPPNDWARSFVAAYRAEYDTEPDYLAANYYESLFMFWDLVRRVLKDGGDPKDGVALQDALLADPEFRSVYGGGGAEPGTLAFDRGTHSVAHRQLILFEFAEGSNPVQPLAFFDIDGSDYRTG